MNRRTTQNVLLLIFVLASFVSLKAWTPPEGLCNDWSCGTCNYSWQQGCFEGQLMYAYQLSDCDTENQEMCGDNELTCTFWCTSIAQEHAKDDCEGWPRGCHMGLPGNSACDEMAGTMECECVFYNSAPSDSVSEGKGSR